MPHGKITGARTPQEPCKPHSAYVSAELRHVRAGVHGPAPRHERSCEFVLAEDPGDDDADCIIDASHELRDATEPRTSSRRRTARRRRRRRQRQLRHLPRPRRNRLDHRTSTPRARHPTPRARRHRQLRPDRHPASRLHPFDRASNRRGPSRRQSPSSPPGQHRRRRRHRLGTKVGRDLTQRNEHALECTGVRAPQGRRRVGSACPGDPKGGYPGAQARRRPRTKPTTPCFGPEPPALPMDSGASTRRRRCLLLGPSEIATSAEAARRHRACARRARRRQAQPVLTEQAALIAAWRCRRHVGLPKTP